MPTRVGHRIVALVSVVTCVALAMPNWALAEADEKARTLFRSGAAYFADGDFEAAQKQFERAYELSHRAELLYNVSLAAERTGNLSTSVRALETYLQDASSVPGREELEQRLAIQRRRLAEQQRESADRNLEMQNLRTQVEEAQSTMGPQILPVVFKDRRRRVPLGAIISFSAAGVGAVMGGSFGILALNKNRSMRDGCHKTGNCTSAERNTLRRYSILADVGLGLTIVGAGLGTFFMVRDRKKNKERKDDDFELTKPITDLSVAPFVGNGGGGVSAMGRF